jgi:hypothetical protein
MDKIVLRLIRDWNILEDPKALKDADRLAEVTQALLLEDGAETKENLWDIVSEAFVRFLETKNEENIDYLEYEYMHYFMDTPEIEKRITKQVAALGKYVLSSLMEDFESATTAEDLLW